MNISRDVEDAVPYNQTERVRKSVGAGVPDRPNTRTDAVNYEGINQKQGSRKMRVAPEFFWEEGAYRSTNAEQVLRTSPPSRIKFEQAKRALTM